MGADQREALEREVRETLRERFPDVSVYDVELTGGRQSGVTVYIDRKGGVDLDTCAAVSAALDAVRDRHALEVSSPGLERRLRRPEHFSAVVGRPVAIRTTVAREGSRMFRGTLAAATPEGVTLTLDEGGDASIGYDEIARANLVYRPDSNGGRSE